MFRSRLFWKLFLTSGALNLLAIFTVALITLDWQRERLRTDAITQLQTVSQFAADYFAAFDASPADGSLAKDAGPSSRRQTPLRRWGGTTGFRLSLIDSEGTVLADSSIESVDEVEGIDSLAQRPEVVQALASGQGTNSQPPQPDVPGYFAAAQSFELPSGKQAVILAAIPYDQVMQDLPQLKQRYFWISAITAAVGLAAIYALVRHIVVPVLSINRAANAIVRGDYEQRIYVTNNDELGALARSFSRMRKVLGRKLAELRDSSETQATVLGGMIEGVIAVDSGEHVLFANLAAGKLFGFTPTDVEGRELLKVVRHRALHNAVARSLASGQPSNLTIEWDASMRLTLAVQVTPLPGQPCPGVVAVLHDTTELRRLESLRQDFVANVSHELKTPLSSIKAYTETLLNGAINDEVHSLKFLERIEEQADRLNSLIHDLLSLARIESEQQPFEIGRVRVSAAAAECLKDHQALADAKQIELIAEGENSLLDVEADPEGLRVILNNLVDNAIKYTPDGGRVSIAWKEAKNQLVEIRVTDTGIGIPSEKLPRVFERFFRVDKARSRELGGTGLGLSIVKHLTQSFGGQVSVDSVLGDGSTFTVVLPSV